VEQKGSLVNEAHLRFDFSHFAKVTEAEIMEIEQIVNQKIRENILRDVKVLPIDEAKSLGAMALFGEKYADVVRVVTFDPTYSVELCGGTHVSATGNIAMFKITSEGAVAAGIRRIEAITGKNAEQFFQKEGEQLHQIKSLLSAVDPIKKLQQILDEKAALEKKIESFNKQKAAQIKKDLIAHQVANGNCIQFIQVIDLDAVDAIKTIAFEIKDQFENAFIVLGHVSNGKPMLTVALGKKLTDAGLSAVTLVKEFAKEIKGGGGGQAFFATAGGTDASGLETAIALAKKQVLG
jgi:alanyl-tRNA synthetase